MGEAPADEPKPRAFGRLHARVSLTPRDLMAEVPSGPGIWTARVITLFPEAFPGTLALSLTGKALDMHRWHLEPIALRPFGEGKHRNVDDTPAGGGAGMVLRADVLDRALKVAAEGAPDRAIWPVIYLSPRGRPFDQAMARRLASCQGVTLLCGRFEGVDQRVLDLHAIEEVSLGDFVLTGGEIAAQAVLDAVVRLLPGVLGNAASTVEESFSDGLLLEHPQFTRPQVWEGREIPQVLTSGNHAEIARWRRAQAEALTEARRPDLWARRPKR